LGEVATRRTVKRERLIHPRGMRVLAALLIAQVLLAGAACVGTGEKYAERTYPAAESGGGPPVGEWYGSDGEIALRVSSEGDGYSVSLRLPARGEYQLVDARIVDRRLNLWVSGDGETKQLELAGAGTSSDYWRLIAADGEGYVVLRDPTPEWRAARKTAQVVERSSRRANDFLHWLRARLGDDGRG
jgi:hypothetical protein